VSRPTQLGHYPTDDPGSDPNEYKLQRLAYYPEEEWNLQNVLGKDLHRGIDLGRLRRGLAGITKGDIPGVCFYFIFYFFGWVDIFHWSSSPGY
jgi:hypothetical protein